MIKTIGAVTLALAFASSAHAQSTLFTQNASDAKPVAQKKKWQEDFSNLSQTIGQRILLTDATGLVREGVLVNAMPGGVTMRFSSGLQSIPRAEIAKAERLKDSAVDGLAKGVLVGLLCVGDVTVGQYLGGIATMGAIGYLLDAAVTNHELIYGAAGNAPAKKAALTLSFRF
jgi:hypothetical protein